MLRSGLHFRWGGGRDPSPLTPEVVCVFKMATPYVTDETGGECGRCGAASPRALGVGVRTWKGVCAPPIPGPLLCPALRTAFPIHSLLRGVTCAPFWSRVWGVFASGHPNRGVLQCWTLLQDPHGPLAFVQKLELPYLFWVFQAWGLLHSQFPPIPALPLFPSPPPSLSVPAFCPTLAPFKFFFLKLYLLETSSLLHSSFFHSPLFSLLGH